MRSIVEATSWMDWWTFTMKSLVFKSSSNAHLIRCLSLAGGRCQLLVAKTASTLQASLMLKRRNTVLAKVKDSISFESFMDLRNARLSTAPSFSPRTSWKKWWRSLRGSFMMRPFARLCPRRRFSISLRRSCIFRIFWRKLRCCLHSTHKRRGPQGSSVCHPQECSTCVVKTRGQVLELNVPKGVMMAIFEVSLQYIETSKFSIRRSNLEKIFTPWRLDVGSAMLNNE